MLPPPHDITITHNTAFQTGTLLSSGDNHIDNPIPHFVFTDNIQPHNTYGVFGSGTGVGNEALVAYFTRPVFTNNVIEALPSGVTPANYPAGNFFPPDWTTVQFVDFAGGITTSNRQARTTTPETMERISGLILMPSKRPRPGSHLDEERVEPAHNPTNVFKTRAHGLLRPPDTARLLLAETQGII